MPELPEFSPLISGMWRLADWNRSVDDRARFVNNALSEGITSFDLADIYGDYRCERLFGEILASDKSLRPQIQIISKCGIKLVSPNRPGHAFKSYDTSASHIRQSVENSLRALNTDYLDVLLLHRPDALMNAAEVAESFVSLRESGKVRFFGVSNFNPGQFDLLQSALPFELVTNQIECSALEFDVMHDGTLDQCQMLGIRPMAWSPMARGRLFNQNDAQATRVFAELANIGSECDGASVDQVAIAWLLKHPSRMLPILGTGNIERLRSAAAATTLHLTREQWYRVWSSSRGHDVP